MSNRIQLVFVLVASLVLCWATPTRAVDVFLNGKKITGYTDVDLGKVGVRLDEQGNVQIDAPDFKVQEVGAPATKPAPTPTPTPPRPPPNPANLKNMYFIITQGTRPGVTGYDVKLMVNNKYIKTMSDTVPQHVVELNEYLKAGTNTISFLAARKGRSAQTTNPDDHFTMMIGVGSAQGGQLNIEQVLHEFKLKAIETGEKAKSFQIDAR